MDYSERALPKSGALTVRLECSQYYDITNEMFCSRVQQNSDLHAPGDIDLDTGRLQQEESGGKKNTPMP